MVSRPTEAPEALAVWKRRPTSRGVRKTPRRLEAEAAQTAAGTLPPATEVKAMLLWTVEGRQAT